MCNTFKGRNNDNARALLEKHNITEVVVPANTTAFNQPFDVSVNRPCKHVHFTSKKFQGWYAGKVEKDINVGQNTKDIAVEMHGDSNYA